MAKNRAKTTGFWFGFLGALVFSILRVAAIRRSTSSTAPIAFIFLPVFCLFAFAVFYIFGYCVGVVRMQLSENKTGRRYKFIAALLIAVCATAFIAKESVIGLLVMRTVSEIEKSDSSEKLVKIFNDSSLGRNKFVLGAIAQNEKASPDLLDKIAHLPDPELHDAMGSLLPVLGKNGKGLAVMRLVVYNPNVSPETVEYLAAHTQNEYVFGSIAGSPKTSIDTLRSLERKENYLIDWGLAQNRNTPSDVFARLLTREKSMTHRTTLDMMTRNPSTPPDIQTKAAELIKASQ